MVHIEDMGSQFDVPIDVLWKFIQSSDHNTSHTGQRNHQAVAEGEMAMRTSWEQDVGGHWVKVENRLMLLPPVAMIIESLQGPLAGSRFIFYYRPDGPKTVVNAVGDFQSKMIPSGQLEAAVLGSFEQAFTDDNKALKAFAQRK